MELVLLTKLSKVDKLESFGLKNEADKFNPQICEEQIKTLEFNTI